MLLTKKRKSIELGHWDAVKANDSNRDTTKSHQAFGLIESETYYVLITWPSPRDFWEWLWKADTSTSCHCFTFLLFTVDFDSLSIGLCQRMRDTTFMQQSVSDFRNLLPKSKAMKSYQNCLQRAILWKHLLEIQGSLVLKMEKYKTYKWSPQDESGKLWN